MMQSVLYLFACGLFSGGDTVGYFFLVDALLHGFGHLALVVFGMQFGHRRLGLSLCSFLGPFDL